MNNAELDHISVMLGQARTPEEVFGSLTGTHSEMLEAARKIFRQLAKAVHPDTYQGTDNFDKAGSTFKQLVILWEEAQRRIEQGNYGTTGARETFEPLIIHTGTRHYSIERLLAQGDFCGLYVGSFLQADKKTCALFKIPLQPEDNDLVANEARILEHLRVSDGYSKLRHFVSQLVDHFSYHEKETGAIRHINVLSYMEGLYSLKDVREAYKEGIDPKDMAWIWRRLLIALSFAHTNHVIHGAVLPTHVLIHPQQHGVVLIDWSYAVLHPVVTEERISAISSAYREWYPAEVFAKEIPTPGLDVALAARCMVDLLGGNPHMRTFPTHVPWQLQNHLKACMLAQPQQRPQDVYDLLEEFDVLIEQLWGPRTFHEFTMPRR